MATSDDELALRVTVTGDRLAFGELTRRHQATVRSTLMRLARDSMVVDDLAQETFIRAYLRIDQYVIGRSFQAWLGGIAYREFLKDQRKHRKARHQLSQLDSTHTLESLPSTPESIDLDRALLTLRSEERTAVILCYASGMSHTEVSEAMSAPLGTVKSWVRRGRAKLEVELREPRETNDGE